MPFELLQHIVVTLVALGAAAVVVYRVAGVVRTPGEQPKCSSCPKAAAPSRTAPASGVILLHPVDGPARR